MSIAFRLEQQSITIHCVRPHDVIAELKTLEQNSFSIKKENKHKS
jgi:hypothetical protein